MAVFGGHGGASIGAGVASGSIGGGLGGAPGTSGPSGPSGYGGVHGKVPGTSDFGKGRFGDTTATPESIMSLFSADDRANINPATFQAMLDNPVATMTKGFFGDTQSKVRSALDQGFRDVTVHGKPGGLGAVTGLTPDQAQSPISTPYHSRTNIGQMDSPFGLAATIAGNVMTMAIPALAPVGYAASIGEMAGQGNNPFGMGRISQSLGLGNISRDIGDSVSKGLSSLGNIFSKSTAPSQGKVSSSPSSSIARSSEPSSRSFGPTPSQLSPIVQQAVSPPTITPETTTVVEGQETISQVPTSLAGILGQYVGTPVTAQTGGGIQSLINRQKQDYGVANQDSFIPGKDAFERKGFTPNQELMNSSYVDNIMQGHTVPLGMHSAQQPTKPFDPFPSGGQMNNDNTQYADFSKAQSFYAMPNMNRVT
tara:strand:+ start:436 stop:1707 length:1272 start_codon:yes stop_codon:yes gene_type:complete